MILSRTVVGQEICRSMASTLAKDSRPLSQTKAVSHFVGCDCRKGQWQSASGEV